MVTVAVTVTVTVSGGRARERIKEECFVFCVVLSFVVSE
jgi:hypothetical protein